MKNFHKNKSGGQVIMITVVAFLIISLAVIFGVAVPTSNQVKSVLDMKHSKQGYESADAVNEEAFYRLNHGQTLPSTISLPFSNNVSATAIVTTSGSQTSLTTTGTDGDTTRYGKSIFSQGTGASFSYGLQVGAGGIIGDCGTINGSVYSNGDIIGTNCTTITGAAVVANTSDSVADQSNSAAVPDYDLNFATTSAQDIAQSFKVTNTSPITNVRIYIKKTGSPGNITVHITNDVSGHPNTSDIGSGTLSAGLVTSSYGYVEVPISPTPTPALNTTYWVVLDGALSGSTSYAVGATNNTYASGTAKIGTYNSGSWNAANPSTADLYFNVYLGGHNGSISASTNQNNRVKVGGIAWAHQIDKVSVTGTAYCQASTYLYNGSGTAKNCDNSRADPVQLSFPVSDANIEEWKEMAAAGGSINGNVTVSSASTTGAKKINGNLTISSNAWLTLKGPLWVTGNITMSPGNIKLDPSVYTTNDGLVITDGTFTLGNGGKFQGSGTSGSFIMLVSTSTSASAAVLSGDAGAVIVIAPYGTAALSGGAKAQQISANKITFTGNSQINFDSSGISSLDFSTGPSGSWNVDSWAEVSSPN